MSVKFPAEHRVSGGTYIPDTETDYPSKPDEPLLHPKKTREVSIDSGFHFLPKTFREKALHYLVYLGIFVIVFPLHRLRYGLKVRGRKNLRRNRPLLKDGAMTVCNHVYRWDFLAVLQAVRWRRLWFPAMASNFATKDATLIQSVGGIPIPEKISAMREFNRAFDSLNERQKWLHVFPEACRWDWYEPIRPFRKGTFGMAVKYGIPVVPLAISYRPVTGWRKLLGMRHPLVTITVGEPICADPALPKKEAAIRLLEQSHAAVCALAGIEQNCWPPFVE